MKYAFAFMPQKPTFMQKKPPCICQKRKQCLYWGQQKTYQSLRVVHVAYTLSTFTLFYLINGGLLDPQPNFIELLLKAETIAQYFFCFSKNEQDTSHNLHMWQGSLAGNLILLSIILLCLATFYAEAAPRIWAQV